MWLKKGKVPFFCTRVFALLLPVFILNLCVLVPIPKTAQAASVQKNERSLPLKRNNKFLLEIVFNQLASCHTDLPDSTGSGLLEELNEVKEDWHHNVPIRLQFEGYYTENLQGELIHPLTQILEDARLSPPPEYVA